MRPEPDEPPFHAAWEARALAVTLAMGATGSWNIDMSRAARETLPDYDELDYYRIWLKLPGETRDFVPAIVALKRIGRDPKAHGF